MSYGEFEGLMSLGSVDVSERCYDFDIIGVWKDDEGNLYWAADAGCSCPAEWENTEREDLEAASFHEIARIILEATKEKNSDVQAGAVDYIAWLRGQM